MSDKFIFFWGGECSQWTPSSFEIVGITFNCAEQWMMYNKALIFADYETADKIMATDNPQLQKKLGRSVSNYNDSKWMEEAYNVVVDGNRAKFTQNPELHAYLKGTGDKIIVEASPYDKRWGIGMAANHPDIEDPTNWKGENLLGKAIMQVRNELFDI